MHAHFEIVEISKSLILLRDLGPWSDHMTITNDAEHVVEIMAPILIGRRLEYIDSLGHRDRLLVENGRFAGFAPILGKI